MVISLVACSNKSESNNDSEFKNKELSSNEAEEDAIDDGEIEFEELTVIDNNECVINITGIEPDNMWGYTVTVYLENKSTEKNYTFLVESAAVDGVQTDPFFTAEVSAGKKSNEEIIFSDEILQENGITEFTDIELSFRVYDSENWDANSIVDKTIHIYPFGEENSSVFERKALDSDNIIVDNDLATVTIIGYSNDDDLGYSVKFFLENKTDKALIFNANEVSINGYMIDPFWAIEIMPKKFAFSSMTWFSEELESNGISNIENIEFMLSANDYDTWGDTELINEKIILNP